MPLPLTTADYPKLPQPLYGTVTGEDPNETFPDAPPGATFIGTKLDGTLDLRERTGDVVIDTGGFTNGAWEDRSAYFVTPAGIAWGVSEGDVPLENYATLPIGSEGWRRDSAAIQLLRKVRFGDELGDNSGFDVIYTFRGLPSGGTDGQLLARQGEGYAWIDAPTGGGTGGGLTQAQVITLLNTQGLLPLRAILSGEGAPARELGAVGFLYIDELTGNFYRKQTATDWGDVIIRLQGQDGDRGIRGTRWFIGPLQEGDVPILNDVQLLDGENVLQYNGTAFVQKDKIKGAAGAGYSGSRMREENGLKIITLIGTEGNSDVEFTLPPGSVGAGFDRITQTTEGDNVILTFHSTSTSVPDQVITFNTAGETPPVVMRDYLLLQKATDAQPTEQEITSAITNLKASTPVAGANLFFSIPIRHVISNTALPWLFIAHNASIQSIHLVTLLAGENAGNIVTSGIGNRYDLTPETNVGNFKVSKISLARAISRLQSGQSLGIGIN